MPYSTDPEANKQNPSSPSSSMGMEAQLIYKIASLESTMSNSLRRLDEKFDRLLSEIHDRHIEMNQNIVRVENETKSRLDLKRRRIDDLEKELHNRTDSIEKEFGKELRLTCERLQTEIDNKVSNTEREVQMLKEWKSIVTTRVTMAGAAVIVFWAIAGQPIQDFVARVFGGM